MSEKVVNPVNIS